MKVLVTGVNGQLGYDVCAHLSSHGIEYRGVDIADFDLTNEKQTRTAILNYSPNMVVHCAAYTAVDRAEKEKELCHAVNVLGTRYIAEACKESGAKMTYISTDYVFDGQGDIPFETDSRIAPVNYYGLTKALGEDEVHSRLKEFFIVRISWVFGINGNNFVKTMKRLGAQQDIVKVVSDQIGSPTYTNDLAKLLCSMIQTEKFGVYHATNEGYCSWYEFASTIMAEARYNCHVDPIQSVDYPTLANRPYNSRLSKRSLDEAGFTRLQNWQSALKEYISLV